jgi:membrane associated rhomboid family serine protease
MTLNPITNEPQLRRCPNCGNPTLEGTQACGYCGAVLEEMPVSPEAATEYRFLRVLFTRPNHFTSIFIGINVGVFVLMCLAGGFAVTSVDPEILKGFGAKQNDLIVQHHEYWRLITSIFIHIGVIHLLLNNYALWIIGQEIEQIYGSARFVVLYLVTGVIGSLASFFFNPHATSAGASGSIFGLFGVMATFAFRYRKEIPPMLSREIRRRVLPIIAINLVFGFSVRIVDNAAHIGGLLSGVVLALIIPYKRPTERNTPRVWVVLQIISLLLMLCSFVAAFRDSTGPRLSFSNLTSDHGSAVEDYYNRMQEARRLLGESFRLFDSDIDGKSTAEGSNRTLDSIERAFGAANGAPRIDAESDQFRTRLIEILNQQKSLIIGFSQSPAKNREAVRREERALRNKAQQFESEYRTWLSGFLKDRGYEEREGDN